MSKETEFTVFCMESYKVYKSLSGKQVSDLFRQYDVFDYIREFIPQAISISTAILIFI